MSALQAAASGLLSAFTVRHLLHSLPWLQDSLLLPFYAEHNRDLAQCPSACAYSRARYTAAQRHTIMKISR